MNEKPKDDKKKRQEQVKKILLMPIICNKCIKGIVQRGNLIYSGQKYRNSTDEDMLEFAVGFYEIIYRNTLNMDENKQVYILNENEYFSDPNFAGDTMNSFKTISKKYEKSFDWTNDLWEYFVKYHCLANFWILPMDIGRTSSHAPKEFKKILCIHLEI